MLILIKNLLPHKLLVQRFWTEMEKFKTQKNESDLFMIIDCFIDYYGSEHRDYVLFVIKLSIVFECALNNLQ